MFEPEKMVTVEFFRVIFEFLSLVFLVAPEESMVDQVIESEAFSTWPLESDNPELRQGLHMLQHYCRTWTPAGLDQLQYDYTSLFLGLERTLAPPYESVFLSEEHLVFDRQTLQVRALYEAYGLQAARKNGIPDDHLSYELQFVAVICDRLVAALRKKDVGAVSRLVRDGAAFLDEHLLAWLPEFTARVTENTKPGFYAGMALTANASAADFRIFLRYLS